ncbi:hypothetical protein FPZ43_15030 [Mucilaginibacter pallidiroseus]|uniref:Lipoprotein n=1 Tax=Mucilaginibacter pallidiroseus TaxID=2599295 RepID=A0A563U551_9SPHI|nr:hypothetical protein [Mucilaginibacter pallidiroseus]TWR26471.1 hypothetical protein FPZ43_15030 [Mucilaginibacter pallidiroseus]
MKLKGVLFSTLILSSALLLFTNCTQSSGSKPGASNKADTAAAAKTGEEADTISVVKSSYPPVNKAQYDSLMKRMANGDTSGRWPVKNAPYPLGGAVLPFKRVVAFYGNLYSKKMGILGELPANEMLAKLKGEVKSWEKADPKTPVQPALHYIAVVAQGDGGKDGKYRYRMPFKQIDSVLVLAKKGHALVFLDVQVALSTIQAELPLLEKYLKMPQVHFGMDPEFSMKDGTKPGKKIGTYDANDINYVSGYLANLVKKNGLPPKMLVVHRFTRKMVTNYQNIKLRPEVQVIMDMDGWGEPDLKFGTYRHFINPEPVQFTGFKLFYKNDLKKAPHHMLTPQEVLKYKPAPMYIQYQ